MRRSPVEITSRASVTTAPSTQPPDTDPTTSPSSLTAIAAPGSRGPEPSTATTRASAMRFPFVRQRSRSSSNSFTSSFLSPLPVGCALLHERVAGFGRVLETEKTGRVVLLRAIRLLQRKVLDAVHRLL